MIRVDIRMEHLDALSHMRLSFKVVMLIRGRYTEADLKQAILKGIANESAKTIPTLVLYDDLGLQLFDQVTYLDEYYLSAAEIDIINAQTNQIVESIPNGAAIIELGSGSLRKTKLLLDAIDAQRTNVSYYAIDLMEKELIKSLNSLVNYVSLKTYGVWGTYDDGMDYIRRFPSTTPKVVMWMGSSIGNLEQEEAADFLYKLRSVLNPGDKIIVGIDLRNPREKLALAYNDSRGVTRDFIMNGLTHCNRILGQNLFARERFEYLSKVGPQGDYHESLYRCKVTHKVNYIDRETKVTRPFCFQEGELIHVEYSFKYTLEEIDALVEKADLVLAKQWLDSNNAYSLNLLIKPSQVKALPKAEEQLADLKMGDMIETGPVESVPILI
ncbi:hypothetical protein L0F63_007201 [Massospora cicadina]|nr:hypothetical protein L0F63_007201 [Massospora cicadina]